METGNRFLRSDRLLKREFLHYFFPAILTTAALSLSEFADSMIVANILDSRAMAIVQLGMPIMLISAAVYILLGCGGSTLYAICLGERDREKAGKIFTVSVVLSIVIGVLLAALGFIFFEPFAKLLCSEPELYEGFTGYLRILLLSMPFLIAVLTFVSFLPPSGSPGMATAVNIIANVVNIGMDVVYLKLFRMGPEGAAWATVTGYFVGALVIVAAMLMKKVRLRVDMPKLRDFAIIKDIAVTGAPFAVTQLGYAIKFAVSGRLAQNSGGASGMEAFSFCVQVLSIVSIFMAAILEAAAPIMALLHGQRDHRGEKLAFRNAFVLEIIVPLLLAVVFFFFAKPAAALYRITDPDASALAVRGLRIFLIAIITRGVFVSIQKQAQVQGFKIYPIFISLFDGVIGILPICFLMTHLLGLDGIFWAYSITGVLLVLICLAVNLILARRSKGKFKGLLLEQRELESEVVMDASTPNGAEDIAGVSEALRKRCKGIGMDERKAYHAALLVEEMGVYLKNRLGKSGYMDVLIRSYPDRVELDFRTIGADGDPNADDDKDMSENVRVLRSIASEIRYSFVMGMNCTEIVLRK